MEFKINQEVIFIGTGQRALILGTKEEPWHPAVDPYHRGEILPENDYLIMLFKDIDNETEEVNWEGTCDVSEREIKEYL